MRSSQGQKCFVMIHYIYFLSPTELLLNTLICKYMGEKMTVLPLNKYYRSLVQLRMEKKLVNSSQICDYRSLSIIITNQSTNFEYYRVLRPDKGLH